MNWFLNLFIAPPPSVDGVIASINQNITDLRAVSESQNALADVQQSIITEAGKARDMAEAEANRADRIANRLELLIA